jgi:molybdopterin converting factor small subunit
MQVNVRFYSVAKELMGMSSFSLDLSAGSTLGSAIEQLTRLHPRLTSLQRSSLFAVGLDYAPQEFILTDGDEISFIPPVQGG